jgi:CDP-diacylglycerol--serine O-phosphatidyltransferase
MRREGNRGVGNAFYIIPNLLTMANMSLGFLSITMAVKGDFGKAALFILLAMLFDGFDGRVAKMTNTCSRFGLEFDSLADIVSFGVAPSILIYYFALNQHERLGLLASWFFVLCGGLRLARFNVQADTVQKRDFVGLPIPAAAGLLSSFVYLYESMMGGKFSGEITLLRPILDRLSPIFFWISWFMPVIVISIAYLMISDIRYMSLKSVSWANMNLFRFLSLSVLFLLLFLLCPPFFLFIGFIGYVASGPALAIRKRWLEGKLAPHPLSEERRG